MTTGSNAIQFNTALDESGLIPQHIFDDANLTVFEHYQNQEARKYWFDDIRTAFSAALNEDRPDKAAALAYAALTYAHEPQFKFDLLNLQGIAVTKIVEAGGPVELHDFRIAAFEKALQSLPPDRGWDNNDVLCRIRLANAWREYGTIKHDADMLGGARDEYAVLLPALREGRWGYDMHAKAAEIASLLALTVDTIAKIDAPEDPWTEGMRIPSVDPDPLPHWLLALELALDHKLRSMDTLGFWDASMEILEEWLEDLRYKPEAKDSGAAVRDVLQALNLPPDNPDYGWVQYYIGVFAMEAGLQADGLRNEVKDAVDEDDLTSAVVAYRAALAAIEAEGTGNWPSTAFQLAYALHSLGEARRDVTALDDALSLYEQVMARLADAYKQEDRLVVAQTQMNLSEAMAQKAQFIGDGALARRAMGIAANAEMGFTLWTHDKGIEVAQANIARISGIIDELERQ